MKSSNTRMRRAPPRIRPKRVSIWRQLLFGDLSKLEKPVEKPPASTRVQSEATDREPSPEIPSPAYPAPTLCDGKAPNEVAEWEVIEMRDMGAHEDQIQVSDKGSTIKEKLKSPNTSRMPIRVARVSERERSVGQRRHRRIESVVEYIKDLVVGRCLCKHSQGQEISRVIMLHADPLVSVDATQYAPGREVPVDLEIPSLPSEQHIMENIISRCPSEIDSTFRHLSRMSLGEELSSTEDISLLHLSAHGTTTPDGKYALVMENECGFADFCLMSRLEKLLQHCNVPQCIVLSACYSEAAAAIFLNAGAKHVVACKKDQRIMDTSARYFNRFFYMALFNGHTVRRAFEIAKANVAAVVDADVPESIEEALSRTECRQNSSGSNLRPSQTAAEEDASEEERSSGDSKAAIVGKYRFEIPESEKFVLLPEDGDHDVILFPTPVYPPRTRAHHSRKIRRAPTPPHPPVPPHALGRHVQVSKCVSMLQGHRCVNVVGRRGVGKSTIAKMCIQYVKERNFFSDGIFYLDMKMLSRESEKFLEQPSHSPEACQRSLLKALIRAMGLHEDPALPKVENFAEFFQMISEWRCLIVLDDVTCAFGASIASQLLRITHKPKVLVTSTFDLDLGHGIHRQVVIARELSIGSSRELIRVLAPWKTEEAVNQLINESKGSPGAICETLDAEMKTRRQIFTR